MLQGLLELLSSLPESTHSYAEHELRSKLDTYARELRDQGQEPDADLMAEIVAFAFEEDYSKDHWGTYYGPMFILPNQDGQMVEFPSIRALQPEVINYWQARAEQATHPCLRLRYADLVWEFSQPVAGCKPDFHIAETLIDATLETATRQLHKYDASTIKMLGRAFDVALSIGDTARVAVVRDAIIAFENVVAQDDLLGTWGFAYDLLVPKNRAMLSQEQLDGIIGALESRLARVAAREGSGTPEILAAEGAALRLERHYQARGQPDEARRVLRLYTKVVADAAANLEPMVAHHWLNQLFVMLSERGMHDEAQAITRQLRQAGEETVRGLKVISQEISIPKAELDAYYATFRRATLEEALSQLALHFVPDPEHITQLVKDLAKKAPLHALIPHHVMDQAGRTLATIGPIDADLEGRVVGQTSQNLRIEAIFLRGAIKTIIEIHIPTPEQLLTFLRQSPVFPAERESSLRAGLAAYLQGDLLCSIAVLIPEIEAAIRTLALLAGVSPYRPGRHGGLLLRTLDDLLRDESISQLLSSRLTSYLLILLTDHRGWNLRNNVCHGLVLPEHLSHPQADRVLHALLLLSLLRERESPASPGGAA